LNTTHASAAAPLAGGIAQQDEAQVAQDLTGRLAVLDKAALRQRFVEQDEFVFIEDFLPPALVQQLQDAVRATRGAVNRNLIPGHKKGGSVSRHVIDRLAPAIAELYRRPEFTAWLRDLCGEVLLPSPAEDAHAYALYFYTEAGDHIGWHYDTSYYKGSRYTLLLGVIDDSSCKLEYRLHTKAPGRTPVDGAIALKPGALGGGSPQGAPTLATLSKFLANMGTPVTAGIVHNLNDVRLSPSTPAGSAGGAGGGGGGGGGHH